MAYGDTEIEIKIPVSKHKFEELKRKLKRTSKFEDKIRHIDTYYCPKHINYLRPTVPFEWLSIRQRGGKTILNYKHWYPEDAKHTHCDEYDTTVDKIDQLEKIFGALNIERLVEVDKTRWRFIVNRELEVALDKVKGLGYFVEVETIKDFGSVDKAVQKLDDFAKSLGLDTSVEVPGGYAFQMMKNKGLV